MNVEPTPTNVRHLLTRAAWIGTAADVEAGTSRSIADTVSALLDTPPAAPPPEPRHDPSDEAEIRYPAEALAHWFFELAVTSPTPAIERLTWFWTGHFANQVEKIEFPSALHRQFVFVRDLGLDGFEELIRAITNDAAMNLFLDLHANTKDQINENYGRELLELFTMGRDNGYTQTDVIEVSRALTGIGLT